MGRGGKNGKVEGYKINYREVRVNNREMKHIGGWWQIR